MAICGRTSRAANHSTQQEEFNCDSHEHAFACEVNSSQSVSAAARIDGRSVGRTSTRWLRTFATFDFTLPLWLRPLTCSACSLEIYRCISCGKFPLRGRYSTFNADMTGSLI